MESSSTTPLHELSQEIQDAIGKQVVRIKSDFGFQHEMLSLEDLARIIGKEVNYLWNLRNRGQMLPIPVRRVGGHDTYWIVHVVQWMMSDTATTLGLPSSPLKQEEPLAATVGTNNSITKAKSSKAVKPQGRGRKDEMSVAKEALLARGLAILEQRNGKAK